MFALPGAVTHERLVELKDKIDRIGAGHAAKPSGGGKPLNAIVAHEADLGIGNPDFVRGYVDEQIRLRRCWKGEDPQARSGSDGQLNAGRGLSEHDLVVTWGCRLRDVREGLHGVCRIEDRTDRGQDRDVAEDVAAGAAQMGEAETCDLLVSIGVATAGRT